MEQIYGVPSPQIVRKLVDSRMKMGYMLESLSALKNDDSFLTSYGDQKRAVSKQADKKSRSSSSYNRIGETLKRKLSLGASRLLHQLASGTNKQQVFKKVFGVREGEKIGKVFRCCLSTTAGPIQGMLFISNENISFCSGRLIKVPNNSANGGQAGGADDVLKIRYKVTIPLQRIKAVNARLNDNKPMEKYIQVVTSDDFDFWFMGFFNHHKAFKYLHQSVMLHQE